MVYFYKPQKLIVLGMLLFSFMSSLMLGAQETSSKSSFNSHWDWHGGLSYSSFYTGMYKEIWNTVDYLAFLQRRGSEQKQDSSFGAGGFVGLGWAFHNKNNIRISFGGEYSVRYFHTKAHYKFGMKEDLGMDNEFGYAPPTGSQQNLLMQGLDHKLSPYMKVSFLGAKFPIDLQLNIGVAFKHLLSMTLKDYDGKTYKVTALEGDVQKPINISSSSGFEDGNPHTIPLNFGLKNTTEIALNVGLKAYLHALFVGFNYTTNIISSSYEVEVGLVFKNNFFKNAWN